MKNNNDFDFIKKEIEQDNIISPDSLSAQNIAKMIEDKSPAKKPRLVSRPYFRAVALAACIAIVFALTKLPYSINKKHNNPCNCDGEHHYALPTFNNYDEIEKKLKKNAVILEGYGEFKDVINTITTDGSTQTKYDKSESSHGETYTQVENVDEADVIKTDGAYIYHCDADNQKIFITKADDEKTERASVIKLPNDTKNEAYYFQDFYLYDNYLILNGSAYSQKRYINGDSKSLTYIYDITDKPNPKLIKEFAQSGTLSSTRMIDGVLYTISNFSVYYNPDYETKDLVPSVYEDGKEETLAPDNIFYNKKIDNPRYIVMSAIDIKEQKRVGEIKSVLGGHPQIYCNTENLYLAYHNYYNSGKANTDIIKVNLKTLNAVATTRIKGLLLNQYSMDEYKGYLRVATTVYNKGDTNNLVVLNSNLDLISGIYDYGKDESIKAVRFMGDFAYVITYRETDPLFVMDLSDVKNPKLLGEAKITGFSSMLHPIDENNVLGLGYETHMEGDREVTDGLKIVLFDVSDKTNPKVKDSISFKYMESGVQYDPKALVVNPNYFAIPYDQNKANWSTIDSGALTFNVEDGKINIMEKVSINGDKKYVHYEDFAYRCTYIDDYLYIVDWGGDIFSHKVK